MTARVIVFGATGYTGRLTAQALLRRGVRPVLAGRDLDKLGVLAQSLGLPLETRRASADDPASVRALLQPGDVLVSTVGPFTLHGRAALDAALSTQVSYLDSTGEPNFIRDVFAAHARAQIGSSLLLTAFGFDYVPGHLAAALALRDAGGAASRVDIGYVMDGGTERSTSEGTRASTRITSTRPGLELHGGRMVERFNAVSVHTFELDGERRAGISVAGSEHHALASTYPELRDVGVYLCPRGVRANVVRGAARALAAFSKVPLLGALPAALSARGAHSQGRGPDAEARASSSTRIIAVASNEQGRELARAVFPLRDPYGFTAEILAWGAHRLASKPTRVTGARGPLEVFGLDALLDGCRQAGVEVPGA